MKSYFKLIIVTASLLTAPVEVCLALDHPGACSQEPKPEAFPLIVGAQPVAIYVDPQVNEGVMLAAQNLATDFGKVCGTPASIQKQPTASKLVMVGTLESPLVDGLIKRGLFDKSQLAGKNEKYIITTIPHPVDGCDEALLIAGSDRRGAIYGIYELSEQIGVSPWYDWADVPVKRHTDLYIDNGVYTAGEPAVKYRGIFLNDEAPCLTGWVKNTYGTNYGDHNFYARVFELILRLRGNFIWPAMWNWAFYADDPLNGPTADKMGIIVGTSHHEPMARNHQEWARNRKQNGLWNYNSNQKTLDEFFIKGIKRMKGTEDVVTIGMRGDGDEAMSAEADVKLLERIIRNQRKIIAKHTGRPASETPQVWALYKEVLDYYDAGLKVPDDVTLLLCDDNWGNVRRLPSPGQRNRKGGWGMYYHVDYVGAPRNSKLLNCTPIQNMWEQMQLTYDYGVDRLWVLNVGDLKPMEYPITLFLDMAWNPHANSAADLMNHPRQFFAQQLGQAYADEAARIFNLLCKYNGQVTPEMLNAHSYTLAEWPKVCARYNQLEAEALRQFITLPEEYQDCYRQFILFPLQLMGNLYNMYYAQAMNHALYKDSMPETNEWADKVEACFERDGMLMAKYNLEMSQAKWNGMMTQKHIGYTQWHDGFPKDTCPKVKRLDISSAQGGYLHSHSGGYVAMDACHFYAANHPEDAFWTEIPHVGRNRSGMAVMPYTADPNGADIDYAFSLPENVREVKVHFITKSTLAFARIDGHRFNVSLNGQSPVEVNYNSRLNEAPENIYTVFYPTVATRVIDSVVTLPVEAHSADSVMHLTISPIDPGMVLERIVVDFGGYDQGATFGEDSPCRRT